MFYSLSEKCGRTLSALFLITLIAAFSVFAQNARPETASSAGEITGPAYDAAGYTNSLKNIRSKPVQSRAAGVPSIGDVDPLFNPVIDSVPGNARAMVVQPDGKILIGGYFSTLNGVRHNGLVRLNADYSVDPSFTADINGSVIAIAVQPDGKILIGGAFTAVNGTGQNFIARLNPNGSVDTAFKTAGGASDIVYDIAVQPDGRIVIGGSFFFVSGTFKPYAARLNDDGSLDDTFTTAFTLPTFPNFLPEIVYSLAVQTDGKILLGGLFKTGSGPVFSTVPIMRLNSDGTADSSFNPGTINSNLLRLALQPDGKIVIGGFFNTINGTSRNRIARLNTDGSLDTGFDPGTGANINISAIQVRPSGMILIGGLFTAFNGQDRTGIVQLYPNGMVDQNFNPNASVLGSVYSVVAAADGNILVAGSVRINANQRDTVGVFGPTGNFNLSFNFNSTAKGGTRSMVVQPDGKVLIAGNFTRANGVTRNRIARFNPDGTLDTTFSSGMLGGSPVSVLYLQPDGKILAGGGSVVRLNSDGSPDTTFTQSNNVPSRVVKAITMQPDGKILVSYTTALVGSPGGTGDVSRLNSDGSLDSSFDGLPLPFETLVVQPDGTILGGGPFSFGYINNGQSEIHHGLFKMNADGAHDRTFRAGFISNDGVVGFTSVYAVQRMPDGKIIVGGSLYTSTSTSPVGVARLNSNGTIDNSFQLGAISSGYEFPRVEDLQVLPNGKIVAGGLFTNFGGFSQSNIARLNADGGFDQSFAANTDGTVFDLAADASGKVLVGGDFESVNGIARTGLARLLSEPAVHRTPYDFDGDGKADVSLFRPSEGNWYLLQSTAGFLGFHFGVSSDKIAPADYDGDGKTDFAVFRPSENTWYIQNSTTGFTAANFGIAEDIPQPGDFNGDGKAEIALFRPSEGNWYTMDLATGETTGFHFGTSGDKPVVGDYDGDGKMDYAVYRPSEGNWYLMKSTEGFTAFHFGVSEDMPVPADYDNDGKTDFGVFRPSEGNWYLMKSTEGFTAFHWGLSTDLPAPADYDGDGKADIAVFRDGQWYLQQSAAGYAVVNFGLAGDKPAPNAFVY